MDKNKRMLNEVEKIKNLSKFLDQKRGIMNEDTGLTQHLRITYKKPIASYPEGDIDKSEIAKVDHHWLKGEFWLDGPSKDLSGMGIWVNDHQKLFPRPAGDRGNELSLSVPNKHI